MKSQVETELSLPCFSIKACESEVLLSHTWYFHQYKQSATVNMKQSATVNIKRSTKVNIKQSTTVNMKPSTTVNIINLQQLTFKSLDFEKGNKYSTISLSDQINHENMNLNPSNAAKYENSESPYLFNTSDFTLSYSITRSCSV